MQRLNQTANENKSKNQAAHNRWLQSYTPLQIKEANNARDQLKRDAKAAGKSKAIARYNHIKDDRLVKQPANPYAMFVQDRVASGDLNGMQVKEYGSLLGREFKELSATQKKVSQPPQKYSTSSNDLSALPRQVRRRTQPLLGRVQDSLRHRRPQRKIVSCCCSLISHTHHQSTSKDSPFLSHCTLTSCCCLEKYGVNVEKLVGLDILYRYPLSNRNSGLQRK